MIEIRNLYKSYGSGAGRVDALVDINTSVSEGELLVILGSSGSGKTTLLNMMGGMDLPDRGKVLFEGVDIYALGDRGMTRYRHEKVGFVFQSFNLIGELTALENVRLVADTVPNPRAAEEALKLVGLQDKLNSYPSQLSGGQQQRVSIARALAKRSRLLLCDEPTGALDFETGQQILGLLERVSRELGKTVVIVTHTQEVARMADRTVRMRNGRIVDDRPNPSPVSAQDIEW
ncbi:MAG: ABC transporter ATP-binding protein [Atopobiaceae bacterium]|nr:ABC transporter ATP-binding protein [Atopobiaceae bacterium]